MFVAHIRGGLHVVAGVMVVEKHGGGDDFAVFGFGIRGVIRSFVVVSEVKGGEILGELSFKIVSGKGSDFFDFGEGALEADKVFDVSGVFGGGNREAAFFNIVVAGAGALGEIFDKKVGVRGEIK